jgi:outer membrane murein-binding lipoprotein Lpp
MSVPRRTLLLLTLLVAALGACLLAYGRASSRRDQASRAAQDLADTRVLVSRIAAARQAGDEGGDRFLDIPTRIKHAANAAAISDEAVATITPGDPQRLGTSDYSEVSVPLGVEGVHARQLITFLHVASRPELGLNVKKVRMARAAEVWNADVTLSYLVFTPRREGRN